MAEQSIGSGSSAPSGSGGSSNWEFQCPTGWQVIGRWGDGWACRQRDQPDPLRVLIDCEEKEDGHRWVHVSVSREALTPSHADMALVKRDFIGNRYAYSVWPPKEKYVNIHVHCLHLWARWSADDGRVLPEFSAVLPGVGRSV